ncbi:hypothetical protein, partial [Mycobacterium tuberculosis]
AFFSTVTGELMDTAG